MGSGQITLKLPYGGRGNISKQVRGSEDLKRRRKEKMTTPRLHVKKNIYYQRGHIHNLMFFYITLP